MTTENKFRTMNAETDPERLYDLRQQLKSVSELIEKMQKAEPDVPVKDATAKTVLRSEMLSQAASALFELRHAIFVLRQTEQSL